MGTTLMMEENELDNVSREISDVKGNKTSFNDQDRNIELVVSEKGFKKIEAAAFYNDYENIEEYIKEVLFREIESDKERHLKNKESKENNKLKK